jgi:RNA recognition motif-containing protein
LSVRVLLEPEGRVAFVYFCNSEEASNALNSKVNIVFNDKPVTIKPIIEDSSNGMNEFWLPLIKRNHVLEKKFSINLFFE